MLEMIVDYFLFQNKMEVDGLPYDEFVRALRLARKQVESVLRTIEDSGKIGRTFYYEISIADYANRRSLPENDGFVERVQLNLDRLALLIDDVVDAYNAVEENLATKGHAWAYFIQLVARWAGETDLKLTLSGSTTTRFIEFLWAVQRNFNISDHMQSKEALSKAVSQALRGA
jgi:hypothetical protein